MTSRFDLSSSVNSNGGLSDNEGHAQVSGDPTEASVSTEGGKGQFISGAGTPLCRTYKKKQKIKPRRVERGLGLESILTHRDGRSWSWECLRRKRDPD